MSDNIALMTGNAGGVGFTFTKFLLERGWNIISIDNNFRKQFFGEDGDVSKNFEFLREFTDFYELDIREHSKIEEIFKKHRNNIKLISHNAAQPAHDFAAQNPLLDFDINARATLNLLECFHKHCQDAVFEYMSTNKVSGDMCNRIPLKEFPTRYEYDDRHFINGIDESISIDKSGHSLFGCSKASADLFVQEYGRYFKLKTVCFRGGCLSGIAHSGCKAHGFLDYICKCAVKQTKYYVNGYKMKQVRDNLDFSDLCEAFYAFYKSPRIAEVYCIGGGHENSVSIIEVINYLEQKHNLKLQYEYLQEPRKFDHCVYYSCNNKFKMHYPSWEIRKSVYQIIDEIVEKYKNE